MGIWYCCVRGCSSNSTLTSISLFRFPRDAERCLLWAKNCGRDDISQFSPLHNSINFRVCSLHFEDEMFANIFKKNRLIKTAVPTIFNTVPHTIFDTVPTTILNTVPTTTIFITEVMIKSEVDLDDSEDMSSPIIVQYIVVRGDLLNELKWPVGALIAQACHAVTAVTHLFHEDDVTQEYLKNLDSMHKVILKAENEQSLISLQNTLDENNIKHKLWIEQPENIPTCLAVKPYYKEEVQRYFKKFKLFKT